MSRSFILPYNMGSRSAKALAKALGVRRIYPDSRSRYVGRSTDTVINWGKSTPINNINSANVINNFFAVHLSVNKLLTFDALKGVVPVPNYTTEQMEAGSWLLRGRTIVCRELLESHSGKGITIVDQDSEWLPEAPMYTEYLGRRREFRVHIIGNEYYVNEKKRTYSCPDDEVNWKIRNHKNGFIYVRDPEDVPNNVINYSITAIKRLGLDFGAVDIALTDDDAYVLEINTAPGLEGSVLEFYFENMNQII